MQWASHSDRERGEPAKECRGRRRLPSQPGDKAVVRGAVAHRWPFASRLASGASRIKAQRSSDTAALRLKLIAATGEQQRPGSGRGGIPLARSDHLDDLVILADRGPLHSNEHSNRQPPSTDRYPVLVDLLRLVDVHEHGGDVLGVGQQPNDVDMVSAHEVVPATRITADAARS